MGRNQEKTARREIQKGECLFAQGDLLVDARGLAPDTSTKLKRPKQVVLEIKVTEEVEKTGNWQP